MGALNGLAASERNGLWFIRDDLLAPVGAACTPGIGVVYAGPIWSVKLYRFVSNRGEESLVNDRKTSQAEVNRGKRVKQ